MGKDKKATIERIDEEIEKVEHHLYNTLGLDRIAVENVLNLVDVELKKSIGNQFINFARAIK